MLLLARVVAVTILVGQAVGAAEKAAAPEAAAQQAAAKAKPAAGSGGAIEDFKADAKEYVMRLDVRPDRSFTLAEEPLLHWSNPARTGEDGAVFAWLLDGRPQVIGSIFTYRIQNTIYRKHEYHSLAAGPLTALYQGRRVWAPRKAGVTFERVPDGPSVPPTARGRLSQMKTVARQFSAKIEDANGKNELRLLPKPLLHYESNDKQIDGALFSFSLGTDPEVILMLEADLGASAPAWRYALARYHFVDLRVAYDGREVWHVQPMPSEVSTLDLGTTKYQDSVYATYHSRKTPVEE